MNTRIIKFAAAYLVLFLSIAAPAQTGGNFTITESVIAGGGTSNGTNGTSTFSLEGVIGQPLAGGVLNGSPFVVTSGFWNFSPTTPVVAGYEADVAGRFDGDGVVQSNDVVQVRRFLNTADMPNPAINEFQRADSAPYSTRGDGRIQSNDVVQSRRYLITADAPQLAGGPIAPVGEAESDEADQLTGKERKADAPEGIMRRLKVENASTSPGQMVTVNIQVDAEGDESEYGFAVNFDSLILTNPQVGPGTAGAAIRDCFENPSGRLNCSVGAFPMNNPLSGNAGIGEIAAGENQILIKVTFTVASNASSGTTAITLSNVNASNDAAQSLEISSMGGTVSIAGPTAATAPITGRVVTFSGRGIGRVQIRLTSASGETSMATTNQLGYFRFEGVTTGETYILEARHKSFQFVPQVITLMEQIGNLEITTLP